jgi:Tfp pilus assembly protein PilX
VAEINLERKQRGARLWIAGLVLLVLVLWGVAQAAHHGPASAHRPKATATDASSWDNIPPRLRQYA